MATALTTVFGDEIKVIVQPRQADRQYTGYPGAHGLTGMRMGTRGRQIVVTGRLASSGANYNAARSDLQDVIDDIEAYLNTDAADYSFAGTTYQDVVFDNFQLIPDRWGKAIHWTSEGYATADFICFLRSLI